jgi:hypothetical protein
MFFFDVAGMLCGAAAVTIIGSSGGTLIPSLLIGGRRTYQPW